MLPKKTMLFSNIAFAKTLSPKISPHSLNGLFVVIIVDFFSYLLATNWNNKFEAFLSSGKYPTSSIINTYMISMLLTSVQAYFLNGLFLIVILDHDN